MLVLNQESIDKTVTAFYEYAKTGLLPKFGGGLQVVVPGVNLAFCLIVNSSLVSLDLTNRFNLMNNFKEPNELP